MISHYTAIVFILVFSMCIMIVSVNGYKFMPSEKRHCFTLLFSLLIVVNTAEWLAASINGGGAGLRTLHTISKFAEFIVAPVIPAVCVSALGGRRDAMSFALLIIANVVAQVVSLFTGAIFWIDAGNVYHRGQFYAIYAAITVSGIIMLLIHAVRFSKQYQYRNVVFLSAIMLLAMLGMVSQMILSYLRLDWVCASIAAIMFYIYYGQLVQQIDSLTTLLNRHSYEYQVEKLRKPASILFFDVDHFKNVNDSYGHSFGDDCLFSLAGEVMRIFGKYGQCYRYGGDEFCVVMTRGMDNVQALISSYIQAVRDLRLKDGRIPHVSIGYTIYNPNEEDFATAIARADAMMYEYKGIHHSQEDAIPSDET